MASFVDEDIYEEEDLPILLVPEGRDDWEGASEAKITANEAKDSGNYETAIEYFTKSMELGGPSALTLANRAYCLLKIRRPKAAISDCTEALKLNPDSAKALRFRGLAYRHLGKWEASLKDIANAQTIDFDPEIEPIRVLVTNKAAEIEAQKVQQRIEEEAILREKVKKQRAELAAQRAREEEEEKKRREEEGANFGGMPGGFGGGMPGGMDNLQQMILQLLMSDPELAAGIQNPKVMKAFTGMMSGAPENSADLNDPEVKSFMEKFQAKLGPLMGMMGGMGGMGGMPDFGGIPEDDEEDVGDVGADDENDTEPATVEEVD